MHLKDWRVKAALQRVFSTVPQGHRLNYVFQRRLGGLPISDDKLDVALATARRHLANARRFGDQELGEIRSFEFGAGWDLHIPLALRALGLRDQRIVDLRPLLRDGLVDDIARRLQQRAAADDHETWQPASGRDKSQDLQTWLEDNGIHYRAPVDARATGLPSASVDLVTSTNTLEHIPSGEIADILEEMKRLLTPGGLCSFEIDEGDHYSYFDPTVSVYNYLRYSEEQWGRYNSSLHFQNRLRQPDYLDLFQQGGWEVLDLDATGADAEGLLRLSEIPLDQRFADVPAEDLAVTRTWVVLRPAG